jgi:RNA polymerase sigma-70 factor (ECF subfamily)
MGSNPSAPAPHWRSPSVRPAPRANLSGSGIKRLDPEVLGAYRGRLLRAAWTLCGSRDSAEDLVQDTFASIRSRPRFLRAENELPYLMRALRNTFQTSRRTAARRPRVVMTFDELDAADRRTAARPEDVVIAAQVFPAIAQMPESFRLALVAVDIAGLSYGEAARPLGAQEATITTRVHRARRRVASELDPEQFGAGQSTAPTRPALAQPTGTRARRAERPCPSTRRQPPQARHTRDKAQAMSDPRVGRLAS